MAATWRRTEEEQGWRPPLGCVLGPERWVNVVIWGRAQTSMLGWTREAVGQGVVGQVAIRMLQILTDPAGAIRDVSDSR